MYMLAAEFILMNASIKSQSLELPMDILRGNLPKEMMTKETNLLFQQGTSKPSPLSH
jgi:hypothetical protein